MYKNDILPMTLAPSPTSIRLPSPDDPDYDPYESLPAATLPVHMLSGAIAGALEHCAMYPLDSIKTRMQSLSTSPSLTILSTYQTMVRSGGLFRPYRGIPAVLTGTIPAHALYFGSYEYLKHLLIPQVSPSMSSLVHAFCGCIATLFHDGIMTPADVVKQRMQMRSSPYRNCRDCIASIYSKEGLGAFYRSYSTTLTMNVPFQSIHFVIYEFSQKFLNPEGNYNPKTHIVSGALAGGCAAALTTPLDVCKTLLNTQEEETLKSLNKSQVKGIKYAVKSVYAIDGWKGFFRGVSARVLFSMPSTAICWSAYEFMKFFISHHDSRK